MERLLNKVAVLRRCKPNLPKIRNSQKTPESLPSRNVLRRGRTTSKCLDHQSLECETYVVQLRLKGHRTTLIKKGIDIGHGLDVRNSHNLGTIRQDPWAANIVILGRGPCRGDRYKAWNGEVAHLLSPKTPCTNDPRRKRGPEGKDHTGQGSGR